MNKFECSWNLVEVLTQDVNCEKQAVKNVVKLLDDDNTIPFIARYRQQQTSDMPLDKLREIKERYEELKDLRTSISKIVSKLEKQNKLDNNLRRSFLQARDTQTVEDLYAPLKPTGKKSLAYRARALGLGPISEKILTEKPTNSLSLIGQIVNQNIDGLKTGTAVETGIKNIIADIMSKDGDIISYLYKLLYRYDAKLTCSRSKINKENDKKFLDQLKKSEQYFNFSNSIKNIKPHQTLAINRAEKFEILKVKLEMANVINTDFSNFLKNFYKLTEGVGLHAKQLIRDSAELAYTKYLTPHLKKRIRRELTEAAEKESLKVFGSNLKNLLLTAPIRSKYILGLDPGFTNGCKYAMIAPNGEVLATGKKMFHFKKEKHFSHDAILRLNKIIQKYKCEVLAIGNGVGSRETEKLFSDEIKAGTFQPLGVTYCIVSEAGASVYSATEEAALELGELSVELRGAVSIARRLQDPLSELIKIDPKVIGVGMYQHDASESKLQTMADSVVEECVSFVGADLNVASEVLLRHIAGIGPIIAKNIVAYREANGAFINRHQLLNVPKIGEKKFEQCSGFLRIRSFNSDDNSVEFENENTKKRKLDINSNSKKSKKKTLTNLPNPLDRTSVHPESYVHALRIIQDASLNAEEIGTKRFIKQLKEFLKKDVGKKLINELGQNILNINQVVSSLLEKGDHDLRDDFSKPLFKSGVASIHDLKVDEVLTGKVMNVLDFGAFVDIGVNVNGLLHKSKMAPSILNGRSIQTNDCVQVSVVKVEPQRDRIALKLLKFIE